MKVLLDENLPHELRPLPMPAHDVFTAVYMRWSGLSNGTLLSLAADHGFDALSTADRGYECQQNHAGLRCSVVLLLARSHKIEDLRPFVGPVMTTLANLAPGSFIKLTS